MADLALAATKHDDDEVVDIDQLNADLRFALGGKANIGAYLFHRIKNQQAQGGGCTRMCTNGLPKQQHIRPRAYGTGC
ncbi:hypothetical protein N9L68_04360 [bacterium]|nr:hypothetical protein [bacterium]